MKLSDKTNTASQLKKRRMPYAGIQIIAFFLALYLMALIALIIPIRPKYSESEKRDLTPFPSFSFSTLVDGTFFDGVSTWFADTFPFREGFMSLNGKMQKLYGVNSVEVHGEVSAGDEIPDAPMETVETEAEEPEESSSIPEEVDLTGVPTQTLDALLIVGDSAYEYYNFVQSTADNYIKAVNSAANQLEGTAQVYDMIVPISMDIMLPSSLRSTLNTSDQRQAIDYFYNSMNSNVKSVDLYAALRAKSDQYIFFRTDHHWTALGAYYSYEAFCKSKGISATPLTDYTEAQYPGFLGSFYSESGKNSSLGANPDTVYTYTPKDTNDITVTLTDGTEYKTKIVSDATDYSSGNKYITFISGDNPYAVIDNPNITDGSACVVVKESFGNAFIPFLVPNYQHVYVVDYRYYHKVSSKKIPELARSVGAKDVIFINNISATRNKSLVSYFANLCG